LIDYINYYYKYIISFNWLIIKIIYEKQEWCPSWYRLSHLVTRSNASNIEPCWLTSSHNESTLVTCLKYDCNKEYTLANSNTIIISITWKIKLLTLLDNRAAIITSQPLYRNDSRTRHSICLWATSCSLSRTNMGPPSSWKSNKYNVSIDFNFVRLEYCII
jgi:hypothetical protein